MFELKKLRAIQETPAIAIFWAVHSRFLVSWVALCILGHTE